MAIPRQTASQRLFHFLCRDRPGCHLFIEVPGEHSEALCAALTRPAPSLAPILRSAIPAPLRQEATMPRAKLRESPFEKLQPITRLD